MENEKTYLKTCKDCLRVFETKKGNTQLCDSCRSHRKPRRKTKQRCILSIKSVLRINKIYNEVNNTVKHYGEMVQIIENTKADRCVCCGDIIPEGRMVCPICESKVKRT
jgi:RNA polymerase subunit RPABC4/transcription elongation factor Spt4